MAAVGVLVSSACSAFGLSYSAHLGQTYSGNSPVSPQSPWLQATFEDIAGGKVRLTMEALNLTGSEFVGIWTFNLNPAYSPSDLFFDQAVTDPGQAEAEAIRHNPTGQNYKAGPEKHFDIKFEMENSAGPDRFTSGERLIYDIGLTGRTLTAADFLFRNQKTGSAADDWYSAAHVQAIGAANNSGWIGATVVHQNEDPPPPHAVADGGQTIVILGAACLGLAAIRRSQRRE